MPDDLLVYLCAIKTKPMFKCSELKLSQSGRELAFQHIKNSISKEVLKSDTNVRESARAAERSDYRCDARDSP